MDLQILFQAMDDHGFNLISLHILYVSMWVVCFIDLGFSSSAGFILFSQLGLSLLTFYSHLFVSTRSENKPYHLGLGFMQRTLFTLKFISCASVLSILLLSQV